MTLGLVGPAPPWGGGISSFTHSLAESLRSAATVHWLSWRPPGRLFLPGTHLDSRAQASPHAEDSLGLYDRSSWESAGERLGGCEAIVLTVTHPALFLPYRSLVRAYRRLGGRVVLLCHNVVAHDHLPGLRHLASRCLRLADSLVVHSAAEAALARELAPRRVAVHSAFHPVYRDHAARPWPAPPSGRRLLAFGYVRPYKGIRDLIAALPLVPDATLDIVGRFEEPLGAYARLALRHGVAGRVRLLDEYVADNRLRELFAAADVVVAPYRQASQSGVIHLAYSFGRPVVATTVGGLADAVIDGETGLLARPGDPSSLAAAVRRALDSPPGTFDEGIRRLTAARSWPRYAELVLNATREDR